MNKQAEYREAAANNAKAGGDREAGLILAILALAEAIGEAGVEIAGAIGDHADSTMKVADAVSMGGSQ